MAGDCEAERAAVITASQSFLQAGEDLEEAQAIYNAAYEALQDAWAALLACEQGPPAGGAKGKRRARSAPPAPRKK